MGVKVLLEDVYYLASLQQAIRGYVLVEDGVVKGAGKGSPKTEHYLSELVYGFNGKATLLPGFSIACTPSLYLFAQYGLAGNPWDHVSRYTKQEIKGFIKAAFFELLINGVTLPLIYGDRFVREVVDTAKSLSIPVGIMGDEDTLSSAGDLVDGRIVYSLKIGPRTRVCTDSIEPECDIVYLKRTYNLGSLLSMYALKYGVSSTVKPLYSPYSMLGLHRGGIEEGSPADIIIYDGRSPPKIPPSKRSPLAVLQKGYMPDIVMVRGDVVVEKGEVYIIGEREVAKILEKALEL